MAIVDLTHEEDDMEGSVQQSAEGEESDTEDESDDENDQDYEPSSADELQAHDNEVRSELQLDDARKRFA
jgi:hypothetical protein